MNLRSLLLTAIFAAVLNTAAAVTIDHDKVQPFPQPTPVSVSEKAAIKFKPNLLIKDGCHPYPAVNAGGETSGGLKRTGKDDGNCKGSGLGSQVYGRAARFEGLWAIMYAWYFPKDSYGLVIKKGHRHKWVSAVLWLDNLELENPKRIALSTSNALGGYDITKNQPRVCGRLGCGRADFVDYFNGTSAKLLYEPFYYEPSVHTLCVTTLPGGEFQDLIMWEQMTEEARIALSEGDFGESAKVPFIDANFNANLETAL